MLIPVTSTGASERLTAAAVWLANQQGSHLVGLARRPSGGSEGRVTAVEQDAIRLIVKAAGERFDDLTRTLRAGRSWCRCEGSLFDALGAHAWDGDLVVLSASELRGAGAIGSLRRFLKRTGCPVLVWPEHKQPATIQHVAVLCDDSPAAARAMRAAAPLLVRCARVSLVGGGRLAADARLGLKSRGVADVRIVALERAVSSEAALRLVETSADVIVVGAWSEFFGGWPRRSATDILLDMPTTPLLLAF